MANNINFLHVEGISPTDTLYFASIENQKSYFLSKVINSMEDSYYPPYYQNVISVDKDDITLSSLVNYCYIIYKNKNYYYFIDNIEYVNESLIDIHITMDTIQTFMFDIKVDTGIIERKFINRWLENDNINRNYIRENLSSANFVLDTKVYPVDMNTGLNYYGVGVIKSSSVLPSSTTSTESVVVINQPISGNDEKNQIAPLTSTYNYGIFIYPLSKQQYNYDVDYVTSTNKSIGTAALYKCLLKMGSSPVVDNLYLIPFNPFGDCLTTTGGVSFTYSYPNFLAVGDTTKQTYSDIDGLGGGNKPYYLQLCPHANGETGSYVYNRKTNLVAYNFNFFKNVDSDTIFNPNNVPCLLDENYIHFNWGEGQFSSLFPLYLSATNQFKLSYYADIFSGYRYYNIYPADKVPANGIDDIYSTCACANLPLLFDMSTETYKTWQANNKATIIGAMLTFASNAISIGMDISANNLGIDTSKMSMILSGNQPRNKGKLIPYKYEYENRKQEGKLHAQGTLVDRGVSSLGGVATSQYNAFYAPNTPKQSTTITGDMLSNAARICYSIYKVQDYTNVAWLYHRLGYKVNENICSQDVTYSINPVSNTYKESSVVNGIAEIITDVYFDWDVQTASKADKSSITTSFVVQGDIVGAVSVNSITITDTNIHIAAVLHISILQGQGDYQVDGTCNYTTSDHVNNIFRYINTRYYYNVLKLSYVDFSLNLLQPDEVKRDIEERFINGLRLWNKNYDIGSTYCYDNVELDYL